MFLFKTPIYVQAGGSVKQFLKWETEVEHLTWNHSSFLARFVLYYTNKPFQFRDKESTQVIVALSDFASPSTATGGPGVSEHLQAGPHTRGG